MRVAPRIAVRVDASATMGTGHLRRCVSLAQALVELGARVDLLVRQLDDVAQRVLSSCALPIGLRVRWLPPPTTAYMHEADAPPHQDWAGVHWTQDAADTVAALRQEKPHWMVIDHYAFEGRWHAAVRRSLGCRLLAIDDLADRGLDADALLDQNWDADHHAKYVGRLPYKPRWLTGPRYALLSSAYQAAPRYRFRDPVRSVGIFMGGTDPGGVSARVLGICRRSGFRGAIEIVSSAISRHVDELRAACNSMPNTFLTLDEPDLAAFFARHDLQIGAGGSATWERCCIGVPTISVVLAANQLAVVPALHRLGVLRAACLDGQAAPADLLALPEVLVELLADPAARGSLGEQAGRLVDGRGAQRVALSLLRESLRVRPASIDDARLLHQWRNHPLVRSVSGSKDPIAFADHLSWLHRALASPDRWLFVGEVGDLAVGCIRFDRRAVAEVEVSIYLDPALQGLGLGQRLLLAGEQGMLGHLGQGMTVDAKVLPGNSDSQRLFEACGYHGGPVHYRKAVGTPLAFPNSSHEDPKP